MELKTIFYINGKVVTKVADKGIVIYRDTENTLYITTTYSNDIYFIIKDGEVINAAEIEVKQ